MNEITRKEIERAIARLEFFKSVRGYWDNTADVEEIDTALRILRAELTRQENTPLTCEGCRHEKEKYNVYACCECSRGTILPDRYEPKGEEA